MTRMSAAVSVPEWRRFIVAVSHKGPMTPEFRRSARSRSGDVRGYPLRRRNAPTAPWAEHRIVHALRTRLRGVASGLDRIVLGAGAETEGQLAHRGALAAAERLGTVPVIFPSDHGGFLGGEYGQRGDPDGLRRETAGGSPPSPERVS